MVERSNAMSRLYRSTRDKVMTGLAGGLSETLGIDSTLFRILLLVSIPFTGGAVIPVYFIAAMVIPKEPTHYNPLDQGLGHRVAHTADPTQADRNMDTDHKLLADMDLMDASQITILILRRTTLIRHRTPVWMR